MVTIEIELHIEKHAATHKYLLIVFIYHFWYCFTFSSKNVSILQNYEQDYFKNIYDNKLLNHIQIISHEPIFMTEILWNILLSTDHFGQA